MRTRLRRIRTGNFGPKTVRHHRPFRNTQHHSEGFNIGHRFVEIDRRVTDVRKTTFARCARVVEDNTVGFR